MLGVLRCPIIIQVPEAIKQQYASPQPLVPSLKDVLRVEKITSLEEHATAWEQEQVKLIPFVNLKKKFFLK